MFERTNGINGQRFVALTENIRFLTKNYIFSILS